MNRDIIQQGQCFLDKTLELTGSIENAVQMGIQNGVSITDDLVIGQKVMTIPITANSIVVFFQNEPKPATGFTQQDKVIAIELEGIGHWFIEKDFKVS